VAILKRHAGDQVKTFFVLGDVKERCSRPGTQLGLRRPAKHFERFGKRLSVHGRLESFFLSVEQFLALTQRLFRLGSFHGGPGPIRRFPDENNFICGPYPRDAVLNTQLCYQPAASFSMAVSTGDSRTSLTTSISPRQNHLMIEGNALEGKRPTRAEKPGLT